MPTVRSYPCMRAYRRLRSGSSYLPEWLRSRSKRSRWRGRHKLEFICFWPPAQYLERHDAMARRGARERIVLPKRRGGKNEGIAPGPAGCYGCPGGFAGGARCSARPRSKHSGHDASGCIAASPRPTTDGVQKPEPLSTRALQHPSDRRPEPQSRRLHEVGLHRP
jgi:hypothetical protein